MILDSELLETTSQLPLFTTLHSQLPQFSTQPQLLIPLRLLRPRPLSLPLLRLRRPGPRDLPSLPLLAQLPMLVLPLDSFQLDQLLLLPMLPLLLLLLPLLLLLLPLPPSLPLS